MKKTLLVAALLGLSHHAIAADSQLKTNEQKASYTLGVDLAKNFTKQGLNIDVEAFTLGMQDALNQKPLRLTQEEMQTAVNEVKQAMMQKQIEAHQKQAEANAKAGADFLAANKTKPGVKTTDSGLQYKVIESGKGPSPQDGDTITAHYKGSLIDGTVFDSSYERGSPIEFPVSNVIKGWQEALKMMKAGDKWEVYIPSELAYGEKGAGDRIGPNSTLIFTIELIKFGKSE